MRVKKRFQEKPRVYDDCFIDGPDEVDENSPAIREKTEDAKRSLEELGFVAAGFCMKPESELAGQSIPKRRTN